MMCTVVTGGAGFIGSCFVAKLNQAGIRDIIIVDNLGSSEKWKNLRGKQFEEYMDKYAFAQALTAGSLDKKIDMIIHFGACSSTTETDAAYLMENNYGYSKILALWALKHRKRFLYASSAATYGSGESGYSDDTASTMSLVPLNMYGYSKHAFDLWVIKNGFEHMFAGFKFFNVFGPNEYHKGDMRSMVHKGYEQIKSTGRIQLFKSHRPEYADGEQKRDFVYVNDAVEMVWHFYTNPDRTGIFNIGTGEAHTWNELANALFKALHKTPNIVYVDMPETLRAKYQYFTQADVSKLRNAGYTQACTPFENAVKNYVTILETTHYM